MPSPPSPSWSGLPSMSTPIGVTPLGLWNARAAGHDAEQVVDTLLRYSRYAVPHALLVDVAETMARYGRLQLHRAPHSRARAADHRPAGARRGASVQEDPAPRWSRGIDDDTVIVHPSERGHIKQVLLKLGWPAEDLAGYVDGEAHADRARRDASGTCAIPTASCRELLSRWLWSCRAALRCGQDSGGCRRHGDGEGDHSHSGDEHGGRPSMARRADSTNLAHRGRDRRVLRREERDPPGHHRDLPGDDDQAKGRLRSTSSCSMLATGA